MKQEFLSLPSCLLSFTYQQLLSPQCCAIPDGKENKSVQLYIKGRLFIETLLRGCPCSASQGSPVGQHKYIQVLAKQSLAYLSYNCSHLISLFQSPEAKQSQLGLLLRQEGAAGDDSVGGILHPSESVDAKLQRTGQTVTKDFLLSEW